MDHKIVPRLTGTLAGVFSGFGHTHQFDSGGRVMLLREHPDWASSAAPGDAMDAPMFVVTTHGSDGIPLPGGGNLRIELREHGAKDYRTTVWKDDKLIHQTIPCDDIRVAVYLANCLALPFRVLARAS